MDGGELDDVLAFLATFSEGSFTAAGRTLGRDASVVSRRVSALEARLGIRVFERSTRRLAATQVGTLYYERMRAALMMMDEAAAEVTQSHNVASGHLRLALPATFGKRWIAPALPEFLTRWPKVTIEAE